MNTKRIRTLITLGLAAALSTSALALADRFDEYAGSDPYFVTAPERTEGGFNTLMDSFPLTTTAVVDGYTLRGRLYVAGGQTIAIQKNTGADIWLKVASTPNAMDPSFVRISPDGDTVALGAGYNQTLFVFPVSLLSVMSPIDLGTAPGVIRIEGANYYDAAWYDSRFLVINAGWFSGSEVYAIDTQAMSPGMPIPLVSEIPGASAGIAVDAHGNLVSGVGYGMATGELRVWPATDVLAVLTGSAESIDYADGLLLAEGVLSAADLGFDADGNLIVAGGDAFGGSGDSGYVALVHGGVLTRVLAGGAPVDEANAGDYTRIVPAECPAGSFSSARYIAGVDMLVASCAYGGTAPRQIYFPSSAPDTDGDGIPDGVDNAVDVPNPSQTDTDGDGIGDEGDIDLDGDGIVGRAELDAFIDALGSVAGDPSFVAVFDFDRDGDLDRTDQAELLARWSFGPPFR